MSSFPNVRASFVLCAALLLAACGGGGGGESSTSTRGGVPPVSEDMDGSGASVGTYAVFQSPSGTSVLQVVGIGNSNDADRSITFTLDHATGAVTGTQIAGTLNAARTELTDANRLVARFSNPAGTEYVRFLKSETGDDLFGVVGQVTDPADIPTTGAAQYNGVVLMTVNSSEGFYTLSGDATISARWNATDRRIDTLLDGLSGQLPDASQGSVSGAILMRNASLATDGSFGGGTLERSGTLFQSDAIPSTQHSGQIYGQNADEIGGVVILDADDLKVNAVFAAE